MKLALEKTALFGAVIFGVVIIFRVLFSRFKRNKQ
jgi:hypothetical protein